VDGWTVRPYVDHLIDLDVPVESVRANFHGKDQAIRPCRPRSSGRARVLAESWPTAPHRAAAGVAMDAAFPLRYRVAKP